MKLLTEYWYSVEVVEKAQRPHLEADRENTADAACFDKRSVARQPALSHTVRPHLHTWLQQDRFRLLDQEEEGSFHGMQWAQGLLAPLDYSYRAQGRAETENQSKNVGLVLLEEPALQKRSRLVVCKVYLLQIVRAVGRPDSLSRGALQEMNDR